MTNATAITVRELVSLTPTAAPTADVLDTGTAAVTLYADLDGDFSRVILAIANTDNDTAMTVAILAGDNPPAQRAALGNLSETVAFGVTKWFGPFESARFAQDDGSLGVTITPASGTIAATITCLRLPRV
jgi:hypothetical protein